MSSTTDRGRPGCATASIRIRSTWSRRRGRALTAIGQLLEIDVRGIHCADIERFGELLERALVPRRRECRNAVLRDDDVEVAHVGVDRRRENAAVGREPG